MSQWLRGLASHQFVDTTHSVPVRLIDFENPASNDLVVSDEVTCGVPGKKSRFDIVLWVNGLPLVVGETKTAVDTKVSWVKGAQDIVGTYWPKHPDLFATNVVSFATEGKEFMYAGVGAPLHAWKAWGSTDDEAILTGWERVTHCCQTLLSPATVLDVLGDYTLYETVPSSTGVPVLRKIVARYPQYEAVERIVARVVHTAKKGGLIYQTQGSGKTLAMVFAAGKLLTDPALDNPTVVLVADRTQLVRQTLQQFRSANPGPIHEPKNGPALHQLIRDDARGLIFTTVHKFANAGVLSTRGNIIVMVDEAHRSQELSLGLAMRAALPNARIFGFTGTPISDVDKNTFDLFGDKDDPGHALHTYNSDRSIADGMTTPIHVSPRLVDFRLDKQLLDESFQQMADEHGLDEGEQELLRAKVSRTSTFFSNPERIAKVCADMVEHFYATVDPLGMKAQVVAIDRSLAAQYHVEITRLLAERAGQGGRADECAVVISAASKDPADIAVHKLTEQAEEALLDRFRTYGDPLKFLVVTSKLGTGFDAPIEGVMYLDKPLKLHTLYQTITRANRPWKNPATGQEKRFGLICDYIGLGDGFARAMTPADPTDHKTHLDVADLMTEFEVRIEALLGRFVGINYATVTADTLQDAHQRIPTGKHLDAFAAEYQFLQGIWETCYPDMKLAQHKTDYKFLSQVYASVMPSDSSNQLLWLRLGAKTLQLVHDAIGEVTVSGDDHQAVIADIDTVKKLIEDGDVSDDEPELKQKTATDVINSLAARLRKRFEGSSGDHPVFVSLSERLDALRTRVVTQAKESIELLKDLFLVARDVTIAEHADDIGGRDELDLLPDPNVGALTQIFNEFAPADTPLLVGRVVRDIDSIVKQVRYDGWASTQNGDRAVRVEVRKVLHVHKMPADGDLFDRAYAYIAEHY